MRAEIPEGSPGWERHLLVEAAAKDVRAWIAGLAQARQLTTLEVTRILVGILEAQLSGMMNERYAGINNMASIVEFNADGKEEE